MFLLIHQVLEVRHQRSFMKPGISLRRGAESRAPMGATMNHASSPNPFFLS